jgi:hypothetical protein
MNSHQEQQATESHDNRFIRHPVVTLMVFWVGALLICLLAIEVFLRCFSGLGNPPLYDLSPLYGYRLKANQVIEPKGGAGFLYAARLTTNNLGLRAAADWDADPTGKILFLGDSVTFGGQYIADSQLFSSVVAGNLSGWQVGNGGVNAWGVENIVGLVMDYHFMPAEVVVTCIIEGDFYRGMTHASSMPIWTVKPSTSLQHLLMHFIWKINRFRYGNYFKKRAWEDDHLNKVIDKATKRLSELDQYLKKKNIRHFIFILPTRSQVIEGEPIDPLVEQALRRYGIDAEYLLLKLLSGDSTRTIRKSWFHDEVHLEIAGHNTYGREISEIILDSLVEASDR